MRLPDPKRAYLSLPGAVGKILEIAGLANLSPGDRPNGVIIRVQGGLAARVEIRFGSAHGFQQDLLLSVTNRGQWLSVASWDFVSCSIMSVDSNTTQIQFSFTLAQPPNTISGLLSQTLAAGVPTTVPVGASSLTPAVGAVLTWTMTDGSGVVSSVPVTVIAGESSPVLGAQVNSNVLLTGAVWQLDL